MTLNESMKRDLLLIRDELCELDKDKARLDWLDKHWLVLHLGGCCGGTITRLPGKLREAIDAAMKAENE